MYNCIDKKGSYVMPFTFEEQCKKYNAQQTVSGRRTQAQLDKMCADLKNRTGVNVKSGTLTPVKNAYTGKTTSFIER